jgi:hypothetical protein
MGPAAGRGSRGWSGATFRAADESRFIGERKPMSKADPGSENFGDFVTGSLPALLRFGHVLTGDPCRCKPLPTGHAAGTRRHEIQGATPC